MEEGGIKNKCKNKIPTRDGRINEYIITCPTQGLLDSETVVLRTDRFSDEAVEVEAPNSFGAIALLFLT